MKTDNGHQKRVQRVTDVMQRRGVSLERMIARSGLDDRIVLAIVKQRYLPSPDQRRRVAAVLGVDRHQLWWGQQCETQNLSGPC